MMTRAHRLETDLVASARIGNPDIHERLAVYADLLQERGDPLGRAIAGVLRDPELEVLGLERFTCANDVEGATGFDGLVCRFLPISRALWQPPHIRSPDCELVLLPPIGGRWSFTMGAGEVEAGHDEEPHEVELARPLLIARTAVSQQAYAATEGAHDPFEYPGDHMPANQVSWFEARDWCRSLGLRLPSEAEWEYACRAGTSTPYCFGRQVYPEQINCGGWADRAVDWPVPVGSLPANAFGLCEMHGNVEEWVADDWARYEHVPRDGSAHHDPAAHERVCRGGSCKDRPERCRSAARSSVEPEERSEVIGFRPARDVMYA